MQGNYRELQGSANLRPEELSYCRGCSRLASSRLRGRQGARLLNEGLGASKKAGAEK